MIRWLRAFALMAYARRMHRSRVPYMYLPRGPSKDCERKKPECAGKVSHD